MKRLALFAIALIFAVTPARAQETSNPRSDTPVINPTQAEAQSPLTDRERDEMRASTRAIPPITPGANNPGCVNSV